MALSVYRPNPLPTSKVGGHGAEKFAKNKALFCGEPHCRGCILADKTGKLATALKDAPGSLVFGKRK